jgi:hypothetical protein
MTITNVMTRSLLYAMNWGLMFVIRAVDLVAAHPSPGKKTTRFIARFKDRATALRVFHNRKKTKNIDPLKKKSILAEDQRVLPSNLILLQNVSVPLKHKHA